MSQRIPLFFIALVILGLVILLIVAGFLFAPKASISTLPPVGKLPTSPKPGPNWTSINTTSSPETTASMMAYYPPEAEILLLDSDRGCGQSYSWSFANGEWTNDTSAMGPGPTPARGQGGLVYNPPDGELVLFGGSSPCGVYNDTWTFANGTWTHIVTGVAPPPLYGFAMTYDAADGYILLTGGCCIAGSDSHETWKFQAGVWTNLNRAPTPVVDLESGMSFDPNLGKVLFVGGYASGFVSQSTWTFSNGTWLRVYPLTSPSNRAGMGLAFDAALGRDVLVGGYTKVSKGVFVNLTDTWSYSTGGWVNLTAGLTASPPFVSGPTLMVYDTHSRQILLFLGLNQTWVFG
jgi:galactose oxidase-like protein